MPSSRFCSARQHAVEKGKKEKHKGQRRLLVLLPHIKSCTLQVSPSYRLFSNLVFTATSLSLNLASKPNINITAKSTISLGDFPVEIILEISQYLDVPSLGSFSQACRGFNEILRETLTRTAKGYALSGKQPLRRAVQKNRVNAVKGFLDAGVDPNSYDTEGHRMLTHAIITKSHEMVDLLLHYGADPSLSHACGGPVRWNSIYTALLVVDDYIVQRLLTAGAKPTTEQIVNGICRFCDVKTIQCMIDQGIDLHQVTREGDTVFRWNLDESRKDVLAFLLEKVPGLLSVQYAHDGETVLWGAVRKGNLDTVRALVEAGIDTSIRNHNNETALHCACQYPNIDIAIYLGKTSVDGIPH